MSETFGPQPPEATTVAWIDELEGDIRGYGSCPLADRALQAPPAGLTRHDVTLAEHAAVAAAPRFHAWVGGAVVARSPPQIAISAATIAADGEEESEISGIPDGAMLRVSGAVSLSWTAITGGVATLTCSVPGRVVVELRCPAPWRDWVGMIHAV